MSAVEACWAAYQDLLQAESISAACLQQTWQAIANNVKSSVAAGRGLKIPGLCTILSSKGSAAVLLSEQLFKAAPQLQPGKGCVHYTSCKQQVQGAETLNTAKLTHQFAHGLSQDTVKLVLRLLVSTVNSKLSARQSCVVDLGVGQLHFFGDCKVAEFTVKGCPAMPGSLPGSAASTGSAATVATVPSKLYPTMQDMHMQHIKDTHISNCNCNSTCSSTHHRTLGKATVPPVTSHLNTTSCTATGIPRPTAPVSITTAAVAAAMPDKPSNCDYNPAVAWDIARDARAAAAQNARIKAAAYVLPVGGPADEGAGEACMPQGKGRPFAGMSCGQRQVLTAAAARLQHEAAAQAAQEAACLSLQAARISALNQQAQAHLQHKKQQTRKLAADLTQQMQAKAKPAKHATINEQPLLVSLKPDAAAIRAQHAQQQAEYRASLDAQRAATSKNRQSRPAVDQEEQGKVEQHHRHLLKTALAD